MGRRDNTLARRCRGRDTGRKEGKGTKTSRRKRKRREKRRRKRRRKRERKRSRKRRRSSKRRRRRKKKKKAGGLVSRYIRGNTKEISFFPRDRKVFIEFISRQRYRYRYRSRYRSRYRKKRDINKQKRRESRDRRDRRNRSDEKEVSSLSLLQPSFFYSCSRSLFFSPSFLSLLRTPEDSKRERKRKKERCEIYSRCIYFFLLFTFAQLVSFSLSLSSIL